MAITSLVVFGLILTGLILLSLSLFTLHKIYIEAWDFSRTWIVFYGLLIGGILGYLIFAWLLTSRAPSEGDLIASIVFLGGSAFIWLASRLSVRAVRETKRLTALERHRAAHDELTKLPNRVFFIRHIDHLLATQAQAGLNRGEAKRFAFLMMDLDRFRVINDTLGHHYGDILLQEVAARLRQATRGDDLLARLGGDEFGVLVEQVEEPADLPAIGSHILGALERPFVVEGYATDTSASIGIASYPEHGTNRDTLLKNAEIAMYEAKQGPAKVVVYDEVFDRYALGHLNILGELRQAIEADSLIVHYQPQVEIRSGRVCGAEALVRWSHPRLGLLAPDAFVPLAEQSGLIDRLNRWVLQIVLQQLELWDAAGIELPISANLSVVNLQDPGFFDFLADAVQARNLPPGRLRLEITESAVMADPRQALELIRRLSNFGIRFSIDDFGTGYSSLSYLQQLPVAEIKLDKSFVANMTRDSNDALIIRSTIELAHNMGRKVIAEGVENQETLDELLDAQCDKAQGYHIAEPMSAQDLERWLDRKEIHPQPLLRAN